MKKTIAIVTLFFLLGKAQCSEIFTSSHLIRRRPEQILMIYQMLKDIHELFVLKNIEYWVVHGTLLGAVRHKGFIPWDLDLDISISQNQENLFVGLTQVLKSLGYSLSKKRAYVYVIRSRVLPFCHMDVILTYKDNDKIFHSCKILQSNWRREPFPLYFLSEELYPLQLCNFGAFKIFVPNNPHPFLRYAYGKDYLTHAVGRVLPNQVNIKVPLLEKDMIPATPLGPLKNNF